MTVKVLLATPAGDCQLHTDYVKSLRFTEQDFPGFGYDLTWGTVDGCGEPTIARTLIAAEFLKTDADVLLGIDADQGWSVQDAKALVDLVTLSIDIDFAAAPVASRSHDHYEMLREAARYGRKCELYARHNFEAFPEEVLYPNTLNQIIRRSSIVQQLGRPWLKVIRIGTGMFCISRLCLEKMAAGYPELTGRLVGIPGEATCFYPAGMVDGVYRGEDFGFCERWRKIGGEIWMLVDARTKHWTRGICFTSNVDESVKDVV